LFHANLYDLIKAQSEQMRDPHLIHLISPRKRRRGRPARDPVLCELVFVLHTYFHWSYEEIQQIYFKEHLGKHSKDVDACSKKEVRGNCNGKNSFRLASSYIQTGRTIHTQGVVGFFIDWEAGDRLLYGRRYVSGSPPEKVDDVKAYLPPNLDSPRLRRFHKSMSAWGYPHPGPLGRWYREDPEAWKEQLRRKARAYLNEIKERSGEWNRHRPSGHVEEDS
jgi:hypothetical protein